MQFGPQHLGNMWIYALRASQHVREQLVFTQMAATYFPALQPLKRGNQRLSCRVDLGEPGILRKDHQVIIRKLLPSNTPSIATWIPCEPVTDELSSPSMLQSNPALRKTSTGLKASISSKPSCKYYCYFCHDIPQFAYHKILLRLKL